MEEREFRTLLEDIFNQLFNANLKYRVWLALRHRDNRDLWRTLRDRYSIVYPILTTSILHSFVVELCAAYDRDRRTSSLRQACRLAKKTTQGAVPSAPSPPTPTFKPKEISKIEKSIENLEPLLAKATILRNNLFAHKMREATVSGAFEEASIKPNELRDLLDGSMDILNMFSSALDGSNYRYDIDPYDDVLRMMRDIAEGTQESH